MPKLGDLRDQLERELRVVPELVDPRGHLRLAEGAHPVADLDLRGFQQVLDGVEVGARLAHGPDANGKRGLRRTAGADRGLRGGAGGAIGCLDRPTAAGACVALSR